MARKRKIRKVSDVQIIDIGDKGKSIGLTPEKEIVMVDRAIPGDLVDVSLFKKRKGVWQGSVDRIVMQSPQYTEPVCAHFGVCGGCKWQDLQYQSQLQYKQKHVTDALTRIAKIDLGDKQKPIIGCDDPYYYRNKMEYAFSTKSWLTKEEIESGEEIKNRDALGFHRAGAYDKVVDIYECHLQIEIGDKIRNTVRTYAEEHKLPFFDIRDQHGLLRNLLIRTASTGDIMVLFSFFERKDDLILPLLDYVRDQFPVISSLLYTINPKGNDTIYDLDIETHSGQEYIVESLGDRQYKIGPKSFFQTNTKQAKRLFDVAASMADLKGDEIVYDLYTGLGSIALYIADSCREVVGIETIEAAILDAKENARFNDIQNATFYTGDVRDVLTSDFVEKHGAPDVVITDPPRAGMSKEAVDFLLELSPPKIVYISCNPSTQARDLGLLKESYDLLDSQAVDMFPHTSHIENVILLKRRT